MLASSRPLPARALRTLAGLAADLAERQLLRKGGAAWRAGSQPGGLIGGVDPPVLAWQLRRSASRPGSIGYPARDIWIPSIRYKSLLSMGLRLSCSLIRPC